MPLVVRPIKLPFKSYTNFKCFGFFICIVFSITITCTFPLVFLFIVKTPKIFTIKLLGLVLRCWMYSGKIYKNVSISAFVIVLMINLLSWLKKKKLPLFPAPSPAWKTYYLLLSGKRLSSSSLSEILHRSYS